MVLKMKRKKKYNLSINLDYIRYIVMIFGLVNLYFIFFFGIWYFYYIYVYYKENVYVINWNVFEG